VNRHITTPVIISQIPQVEKNIPPIHARAAAVNTSQLPVKYRITIRIKAMMENANQNNGDDISGTIEVTGLSR